MNSICVYGDGLQKSQVNVQTSFTVDAHTAVNPNDDVKVVVTSKISKERRKQLFMQKKSLNFLFISSIETNMPYASC